MGEVVLRVENLRVDFLRFEGAAKVVNLDWLEVAEGEVFGLAGESGSGKTTTALAILNLLPVPPARITEGRILFRGVDVLKLPARELQQLRGRRIAMIFQDPMSSLNPVFTVGQQLLRVIRKHQQLPARGARERAVEMLEMVRLPDPARTLDKYPHELSGGMRQRVMIAMALACGAELLIADEPTRALDVTIQAGVLELLRELKDRTGMTVLLIANNLGVLAEMAHRIGILYAGELVEAGPVREVLREPLHPYTRAMIAAVPRLAGRDQILAVTPGFAPDPLFRPPGCAFSPRCPERARECTESRPPLVPVGSGRQVMCHRYRSPKG